MARRWHRLIGVLSWVIQSKTMHASICFSVHVIISVSYNKQSEPFLENIKLYFHLWLSDPICVEMFKVKYKKHNPLSLTFEYFALSLMCLVVNLFFQHQINCKTDNKVSVLSGSNATFILWSTFLCVASPIWALCKVEFRCTLNRHYSQAHACKHIYYSHSAYNLQIDDTHFLWIMVNQVFSYKWNDKQD